MFVGGREHTIRSGRNEIYPILRGSKLVATLISALNTGVPLLCELCSMATAQPFRIACGPSPSQDAAEHGRNVDGQGRRLSKCVSA